MIDKFKYLEPLRLDTDGEPPHMTIAEFSYERSRINGEYQDVLNAQPPTFPHISAPNRKREEIQLRAEKRQLILDLNEYFARSRDTAAAFRKEASLRKAEELAAQRAAHEAKQAQKQADRELRQLLGGAAYRALTKTVTK